jgi:deoxyribodipyrimidine photolyase-related protein
MSNVIIILPDQISYKLLSCLNIDNKEDIIFFYEYIDLNSKPHPKKIAFLIASMRRWAEQLISDNYKVESLSIENNIPKFEIDLLDIIKKFPNYNFKIIEPTCYRELEILKKIACTNKIEICSDERFLATKDVFAYWARGKKELRMEFFYREMRKRYNILIDANKPIGGKWNYDSENRKTPKNKINFPRRISHKKNPILEKVLLFVENKFPNNFGDLYPFHYATNHEEAIKEADHFIEYILPFFGEYQDAMIEGEAYLYHSLLSSYINNGLLDPLYLIKKAEQQYYNNKAPINAVEGFIRQILGWREYIRGIYWLFMPEYKNMNYLAAQRKLPNFYWGGNTNMGCMSEAVAHTKIHAYSHHIQRLMITGNFALIAGINPQEVDAWYGMVYSDAFEWVHTPNTIGMSLSADGGIVASKPYAASGRYINKMSNFCKSCKYDPTDILSDKACPFNSLYWNFLYQHQEKFKTNNRMKYVYSTWNKMELSKKEKIINKAEKILNNLNEI